MSIANLTINEKISLLKELYHDIANKGQDGDTMLAHINPEEAALLKAHGGSGTINPNTGLPEYKKTIKKVAKIAIPLAIGYATGGGFSPGGFSFGSLFSSANVSRIGLGLQGYSKLQERKYQKKQDTALRNKTEAENRSMQARQRYNLLLSKRQRVQAINLARRSQGQIVADAAGGGVGTVGTSSFTGATGAVATQTAANLGNFNVADSTSQQITGLNQMAANYGSDANRYGSRMAGMQSMDSLGGSLFTNSDKIESLFT